MCVVGVTRLLVVPWSLLFGGCTKDFDGLFEARTDASRTFEDGATDGGTPPVEASLLTCPSRVGELCWLDCDPGSTCRIECSARYGCTHACVGCTGTFVCKEPSQSCRIRCSKGAQCETSCESAYCEVRCEVDSTCSLQCTQ